MGEPKKVAETTDGPHYRESKLRDIARQCRFPGARQEILDLAQRYEGRADRVDAKNGDADPNSP
jgi:hypothetical protein